MVEEQTAITAEIKISPDKDDSIKALSAQVTMLLRYAEGRVIVGDEEVKRATEDLSFIARLRQALEDKRKEYVNPINLFLKGINDTFKALVEPLDAADKLTRAKILAYRQEQERKAREIKEINRLRLEAAQREAKLNEGEITESIAIVDAPSAPPTTVRTEVGTLGTMKVTKWEVEDFSKVPDDYKMIDAAKVGRVVRAGIPSIPGIRIWKDDTLKVSTR